MNRQEQEDNLRQSNDPISNLKQMQMKILHKMQHLEGLNIDYKNKQQKQFLKTFMNIMDKMSNELIEAKIKYQNIDEQIEKDQKCVKLTKQLNFFRNQCLTLKKELREAQESLQNQRKINEQLEKQRISLNKSLMKKSKQAIRYKSRIMSLQKRQTFKKNQQETQLPNFTPQKSNFRSKIQSGHSTHSALKKTWHSFNFNRQTHQTSLKQDSQKQQMGKSFGGNTRFQRKK